MRRFFPLACVALAIATIVRLPLWASDDTCLHRTVSVSAADQEFAPIRELKLEDFRGEFRGKPVRILSIVPENRPHRIVIGLDASGSFGPKPGAGSDEWSLAQRVAVDFVERSLKQTDFALLIFNDKIQEQIDFSQRPTTIARRLRQLEADSNYWKKRVKGRTALWDTILVGLELLHNPTSADALYLITDGGENASKATARDVRRRLAVTGTRVFVCLVSLPASDQPRARAPEEASGLAEMSDMTRAVGGAILGPMSLGESGATILGSGPPGESPVSEALTHFYETMLSGYRMEIELPAAVDKWREWKLEFTKERQKQLRGSQLGYTRDLAPCTELPN